MHRTLWQYRGGTSSNTEMDGKYKIIFSGTSISFHYNLLWKYYKMKYILYGNKIKFVKL